MRGKWKRFAAACLAFAMCLNLAAVSGVMAAPYGIEEDAELLGGGVEAFL